MSASCDHRRHDGDDAAGGCGSDSLLLTHDRSGRAWAESIRGNAPPLGVASRVASAPFIAAIRAYQFTLSPILGRHCRFMPTCSVYALACFRAHPTHRALWLTTRRVCRCHPLGGKGFDPPPPMPPPSTR